ncbi:WD repeat-containing protein 91 [Nibea albiflora]|uniref:WD repeat-containing protein 91 n=1 Tax=Nibea albiflora TaxID=240163 RepID=A0ACB7F8X1_NIBAL|nr:WD repeat-containing protein 91 [Nibea albiflora]
MGSAVERTDEHVREYLIYRGFTSTLKHLDSDIKADKEKGFRVDKIIDQLQQFVQNFDLFGLKEYWVYLDRRLFCRLEDVYRSTVNKLRTSLYRYYVICTIQPVLLSFDAEVQRTTRLTEENEQLRQQLFARQTESRDQSEGDERVHHKLPMYVQNADRLGDTELRSCVGGAEGGGLSAEQPFIKLSQEEYGEHHSSIMHCRILSLACSPSGSSFVCSAAALSRSGSSDSVPRLPIPVSGQLLLWDTKTVKQQLQFSLEPEPVAINCTAFNHNGNLLVTGAADGVIRLFDMQRYESAMSWRAHDGEVYSVEFSYDENTVFSIGEDGKFIQWNIHRCGVKQSEQALPQDSTGPFVLSGYSGYKQVQIPRGRLFAFDSEGQHVLTCSSSGGLIYRLNNGEPALESVLSLGGHKAPVVTVDWSSAVDCGTCLTASMDGKIKLSTLLAQKS